MSLVIGSGKSVVDYEGQALADLASSLFTIGVNNSGYIWPCDVIVALDSEWILSYEKELKALNRPIVTRKWESLQGIGLDLIEVDNDIPDRLSGMVAARISNYLSAYCGVKSYVIGLDHTAGHYYNDESDCSKVAPVDYYSTMGLDNTYNLGMVSSKISCWPKYSKLPKIKKPLNIITRTAELAWIRANAKDLCKKK